MKKEVLTQEQAQLIVDGLLTGYKDYLDIRQKMKKKLKVSAGFAFTKGNYIDDGIANEVTSFARFHEKKAGESWRYLEFVFGERNPSLFIIKNDYRLQQTFSGNKQKKTSQYLSNYAKINNRTLDFIRKGQIKVPNMSIQLQLPIEESKLSDEELEKYESF